MRFLDELIDLLSVIYLPAILNRYLQTCTQHAHKSMGNAQSIFVCINLISIYNTRAYFAKNISYKYYMQLS